MKATSRRRALIYVSAAVILVAAGYLALRPDVGADAGSTTHAIQYLGPTAAQEFLQTDPKAVLVDVRTPAEFQSGHLQGAMNLELDRLEGLAAQALPNKDAHLVVYCHSGNRSSFAVTILQRMGYTHLVDVTGGIAAWEQQGLPVVQD
ncbi:MAG TPA: rhodanese-like domain-containing protein [bacterium]|nr:rhodanese-like domain-containing protein [bacterium]